MAEPHISSSQETTCSLPLSQETCELLMQLNNTSPDYNVITNGYNSSPDAKDQISQLSLGMIKVPNHLLDSASNNLPQQVSTLPSALPASENYPGEYSFNVLFNCHENAKWVFSKETNKLYVLKDASFPVAFSTNINLNNNNMIIRAMPLFSSPEHASEPAKRCLNHSKPELAKGLYEAEHLLRSDSPKAAYEISSIGLSVVVPFENPAVGQQFSSYVYKFRCWGSCAGGPNRRPLMVMFTLENGNQVVGRQKIHVKVCANPVRDFQLETQPKSEKNTAETAVQGKRPILVDDSGFNSEDVQKKSKPDKYPFIKTKDKKCYEYLQQMTLFYMSQYFDNKKPTDSDSKFVLRSSSSSECEDDEKKKE